MSNCASGDKRKTILQFKTVGKQEVKEQPKKRRFDFVKITASLPHDERIKNEDTASQTEYVTVALFSPCQC